MSRIGKAPIQKPDNVDITIDGSNVTVKGPLGQLSSTFTKWVVFQMEGNVITVVPVNQDRNVRALHGLTRTLLNNMVVGVSQGFVKQLEIIGVGYRAAVQGSQLNLQLGFSHPVELAIPEGLTVTVEANTKVTIKGADKQMVGDFSAKVRSFRPPEPYKGKGIRYVGEFVARKVGKAGKK
jgi:large subunit ribosomal protein L6